MFYAFSYSYKHGFDGLWQVYKNEGPTKMFAGATMASSRAVLVTIGQVGLYLFLHKELLGNGTEGNEFKLPSSLLATLSVNPAV